MSELFPLDGEAGPAPPVNDQKAQLMIARALEEAGPASEAPARARSAGAGGRRWLAVAAALLFGLSGSAWAAWQTGAWPRWLSGAGSSGTAETRGSSDDAPVQEPLRVGPDDGPVEELPSKAEGTPSAGPASPSSPGSPGSRSASRQSKSEMPRGPAEPRADRPKRRPEPADRPLPRASARRRRAESPPRAPIDLLAEANRRRRLGEWKRAETLYLQSARGAASPAIRQTAWVAIGDLRLQTMNRARDAVFAYRAALGASGPLEAEALWGLARALRKSGQVDEAQPVLRRLVEAYPDRPEADRAREQLAR